MKRLLFILSTLFICGIAFAQTIRWHVGDTVIRTDTCSSGDSITPPTAPAKTGYNFVEWKLLYTRIEYLESTGTQYINTGFVANVNTYVVFKGAIKSVTTNFAGCGADNGGLHFVYDTSMKGIRTGGTGSMIPITYTLGDVVIIKNYYNTENKRVVQIEDKICVGSEGLFPNITIGMFALHDSSDRFVSAGGQKIYSFKIYDNNVLVRDFIPVLDKNGVPCMYDKVTQQFFYNAGTGDFIAGPAI